MRTLFILFFCLSACAAGTVRGGEGAPADDAEFDAILSQLKDPFSTRVPAPVIIAPAKVIATAMKSVVEAVASTPKPSAPQEQPVVKAPELKVSGVVWEGDSPQAIINDRVVGVGDTVKDAKVVAIRRSEVEVGVQGKNFVIRVER